MSSASSTEMVIQSLYNRGVVQHVHYKNELTDENLLLDFQETYVGEAIINTNRNLSGRL